MNELQKTVRDFAAQHHLSTVAGIRFVDLVSEIGELGKEILNASDYGRFDVTDWTGSPRMREEMGDCLFSLLMLCNTLNVDAEEACLLAIEKYKQRLAQKGDMGSER
jgi:NTP pyrophosphatase (non-canonical NTP hydrolase)